MAKPTIDTVYRLSVTSRLFAGTIGGYMLAALLSLWLERLLPMEPRAARTSADMLFFVLYACAVLWAFASRTARMAWLGLGVPAVLLATGLWLMGDRA